MHEIGRVERRTVLKAAGASAAALGLGALAGCGGNSGSGDGTVTIRYSWWGAEERAKKINRTVALFEKKYPKIKVLKETYGQWADGPAQKVMADLLAQYPDIDGVFTEGGMQQGVVRAFEAAHRDFVPVSGTDENGFACQVKKYQDKGLKGVQVSTALWAYAVALKQAVDLLQGKQVKKFIPGKFIVSRSELVDVVQRQQFFFV